MRNGREVIEPSRARAPFGRATIAAALAVLLAAPLPARAAPRDLAEVAHIRSDLHAVRRHLAIDVSARRLFEIGQVRGGAGMTVVVRDLDGYRTIRTLSIPGATSGVGGHLSTVDERTHRLYIVYPVRLADDAAVRDVLGPGLSDSVYDEAVRTFFGVAVVDTVRARVIGTGTLALMLPALPQDRADSNLIGVKALSYARDGDRDLLYLGTQVPSGSSAYSAGNHLVWIHQVDVARLLDPDAVNAIDWSYHLRECGMLVERITTGLIYRSATAAELTIPCRQGGLSHNQQPLQTAGIARVVLTGDDPASTASFGTSFFPISGGLHRGVVAVDPVAERIFVQVDGSTTESGVWAFDVRTSSWIGLLILPSSFTLGGTMALGVDPALGRLYAVSRFDPGVPRSTVVAASTRAEGDQGRLASIPFSATPVKRTAVIDSLRHRVFVTVTDGYVALADRVPARTPAGEGDPDANTVDRAEGEGTGVNFIGGVQAFGARVRWVGGLRAFERNVNTLIEQIPSELNPNTGGITPPPPAEGTRDLHLGRIVHTTLSNAEATARATAAQRDLDNTDADLGNWTNYLRRWGGPDFSEERWPWPEVSCTDFGTPEDVREAEGFGAITDCDRLGQHVSAATVSDVFSDTDVVRIAEARARSMVVRDPVRGVVSVGEAEVIGLQLGEDAGIGRILARAETWATGRPRRSNGVGAGSSYERLFEDVWVRGADGERSVVCGTTCDPQMVRRAVNQALGVRARVDLPDPEPRRARGTPGGYEALIVRDPFERLNETSVNDEADARRLEVPALVVTVFGDGRVPSRVVLSFAGVAAESHYGIFVLAQGVSFRPPPAPGGPPPVLGDFPPPATGLPGGPGGPRSMRETIADGVRVILVSPAAAARAAGLWLLLAGPPILWLRRRGAFTG